MTTFELVCFVGGVLVPIIAAVVIGIIETMKER